jgi:hypothetical protein
MFHGIPRPRRQLAGHAEPWAPLRSRRHGTTSTHYAAPATPLDCRERRCGAGEEHDTDHHCGEAQDTDRDLRRTAGEVFAVEPNAKNDPDQGIDDDHKRLMAECDPRDRRLAAAQVRDADLARPKRLDEFFFDADPASNPCTIAQPATCAWVDLRPLREGT